MNLTRTRETGHFYCPSCAIDQGYRLRSRRPFLTLYFIPVLPLGNAEILVQCDDCRTTWDESVLSMDRASHEAAAQQEFAEQTLRSAVLMTLVDGSISDREILALIEMARSRLSMEIDREDLGRLCSIAQQNKIEAKNYLLTISHGWNQDQRRTALQVLFLAATVDPVMSDKKLSVLSSMREIFNLTDHEYEVAIEEVLQE